MSCTHLSITRAGPGTWLLIDDSTNGTYVDGVRAPRGCPMALRSGCRVYLCASDLSCDKTVVRAAAGALRGAGRARREGSRPAT